MRNMVDMSGTTGDNDMKCSNGLDDDEIIISTLPMLLAWHQRDCLLGHDANGAAHSYEGYADKHEECRWAVAINK